MSNKSFNRRSFVKTVGAAATAAAGGAVAIDRGSAASSGWSEVTSSPTTKTLYGVANTVRGPHAVGKTGNIVARRESGDWEVVVDDGPAARSSSLRTVAVTDDYERIWFAGASGALGAYDVRDGLKYNYSAPGGATSTWEGISVTGNKDQEKVYVYNGSGELIVGSRDSEGCMQWSGLSKPGGGSRVPAVDMRETETNVGHAVDTSSTVYETRDGGRTWNKVGIKNSQVGIYDVLSYNDADGNPFVYAAAGGGYLYRMNCDCDRWTPIGLGTKKLTGVTHNDNDDILVCGASGRIFEKPSGQEWGKQSSPVGTTFYEGAYGRVNYESGTAAPDVIVGSSGTIVER